MEILKKVQIFEDFFNVLSAKRRVLSGFLLGVLVSLLIFSCFFTPSHDNGDSTSYSSFSFFGNNGSKSDFGDEDVKNFTGGAVLATSYERNVSKSGLDGEEINLWSENIKNFTGNSSELDLGSIGAKNITNATVLVAGSEANSSKSNISGEELNLGSTNITSSTNATVLMTGDIKNMTSVTEKTDFGNSEKNVSSNNGSGSVEAAGGVKEKCNIFNGRWVRDEKKPYYPGGSCPYIDDDFNCHKNGRPDVEFLKWKWQPYDCDIPSLNATDFLTRLRGKRILFVGDSLNRNTWESLVCILRHSVKRKSKVYEVSGRHNFKTRGYYSFKFEDYNCSVDYVRSPFLVRELFHKNAKGIEDEKLRLDLLDETTASYKGADVIVFNTGHWWTHDKTSKGIEYYQEGNRVYPVLEVMEAFKKALATWARWVDKNIDSKKTQVVFRGYSLTHFRGGQWNSGGQCHKESEPIYNETFLTSYPSKMKALEPVLEKMKTPVIYLNISKLTDYRKDGHPSIYRKKYKTVEEQIAAEKSQDCSHWCLPGVPDTWNELLYASLLNEGKGSWKS